jgi:hypothetical protein
MFNSYSNFLNFVKSQSDPAAVLHSLKSQRPEACESARPISASSEEIVLENEVRDLVGKVHWSNDSLRKVFVASQDHLPEVYESHKKLGGLFFPRHPVTQPTAPTPAAPSAAPTIGDIISALIAAGKQAPVLLADIQAIVNDVKKLQADVLALLPAPPAPAPVALQAIGATVFHDSDGVKRLAELCAEHAPPAGAAAALKLAPFDGHRIANILTWVANNPQTIQLIWTLIQGFLKTAT